MRTLLLGLTFVASSIFANPGSTGVIGSASAQSLGDRGFGFSPMLRSFISPIVPPIAVARFSTLNTDGTPVPCELTLAKMRGVLATSTPSGANKAKFEDLRRRGIERCKANDDKRANDLLAEALGMVGR
ncbi:MAG TPA: hypothetical protein VIQ29_01740 [Ancylobacter sp.]